MIIRTMSHGAGALIAGLALSVAVAAGDGTELIINGDAETGDLTGWSFDASEIPNGTSIFGAITINANGEVPCEGDWMFTFDAASTGAPSGSGVTARMFQEHALPADAASLDVAVSVASDPNFGSCDPGRAVLTFLDADGSEIPGGFDTDWVLVFTWTDIGQTVAVPREAVAARLDLYGRLDCGVFANVFYDSVSMIASSSPPCPADFDGSGVVDAADLATLLAAWGGPGVTDLDGDGATGAGDLAILLAAWGACAG